jgi:hypothetical protein
LNQYQITLRTGILENVDIRLVVPFYNKELQRESAQEDYSDSTSGLGDIKLIGCYRILSQKKKDPMNLSFGLGVEMPTGKKSEIDSDGNCPVFLQTGSGSWDPIVELGAHKVMGRHLVSSYFIYKMSTDGEVDNQDFNAPDVFKYNFSYFYALCNFFDMGMELNGEVKTKCTLNGETLQDTGGHTVFITPEVHFKFSKKIYLDFGVPVTVYRDLNGEQLSEDYRLVSKLNLEF